LQTRQIAIKNITKQKIEIIEREMPVTVECSACQARVEGLFAYLEKYTNMQPGNGV